MLWDISARDRRAPSQKDQEISASQERFAVRLVPAWIRYPESETRELNRYNDDHEGELGKVLKGKADEREIRQLEDLLNCDSGVESALDETVAHEALKTAAEDSLLTALKTGSALRTDSKSRRRFKGQQRGIS